MSARTAGNLADLVRDAAAATPDKPALISHGATTTWGELDRQVSAAARGLLGLGLRAGDRVAVHLGNTPEFAVIYFGAVRAGLVALPVNTAYTANEIDHVLSDSGAGVIVTTATTAETVTSVATVPVVVAGTSSYSELMVDESVLDSTGSGEDLAVLLYTSGTSGRPKGAMLSHRALLTNLEQTSQIDPPAVTANDVVLLVLPVFHVFGLNTALGSVAWHGATGVLAERFDPVETLELVRREGVTNVLGAPPMYVAWSMLPDIGDAFTSVRLALSGAAPLPPAVLHRVLEVSGRHIFEGYGLTETAPVLTTTLMSEVAKPGSIGRPIPGIELKLVDEQGNEVHEDDAGEILVRGANLFSGYWPDGADGPDKNGWFATGDVALMDHDGDLVLVDRRKELVLVSGFNVYPREVEDVIEAHPDVQEVAVIGIPHPYTGESVKALIVLRAGASLTAETVIAHCAKGLARFKCPTAVEFVAELPHSATGKVSKGRLRELST